MSHGLTIDEIAERAKRGRTQLRDVLEEELRLGHVEHQEGRWHLSPEFESTHGHLLRCVEPPEKNP